jgi:predicted MFS family arabinose efflux permease
MTIGGVAGMVMTAPAGALVDATTRKRSYVIIPGVCTVLASDDHLLSQSFWLVALSQVATAIAGAAIGPAVNGITLGIVRQAGFNRQNGRNQAFNHAGNMVGAGLSGCSAGIRLHRRVLAGRGVRRPVDRFGADDPARRDRRRARAA